MRGAFAALVFIACGASALAQEVARPPAEVASGRVEKPLVETRRDMVVAAHPLAVQAGVEMLRRGGSAIDAAIAAQLVLGIVEPQSSGIGGGGFVLHWSAAEGNLSAYDGRETAPQAATDALFLGDDGKPMAFKDASLGGRPVGTPGLLRMLELAHREHGRLPWSTLFMPAVKVAYQGFDISPRLATAIAAETALCRERSTRAYFCNEDGTPKRAGTHLTNPELAGVLLDLAFNGPGGLYEGRLAREVADAVRTHRGNPGVLAPEDLARYAAKKREPVCGLYRGLRVCGMPPPSSGGIAVLQTLGLLERFDLAALQPDSPEAVHLVSEAYRLAYADRARYVADADFVPVPQAGLLDAAYLAQRSALIDPQRSLGTPPAGSPKGAENPQGAAEAGELPATSHLSVTDAQGNVVSMTSSIEAAFGAKLMVRGFLLNNQLTDFSFAAQDAQGRPVANRVEPGKRPRSAMSPTMVFDEQGRVRAALGSPGGANIIQYVSEALLGIIDWKLDLRQAIALPHFGPGNGGALVLERGTPLEALRAPLEARGHRVVMEDQNSGLHGFTIDYVAGSRRISGAADPRREGVAAGDAPMLAAEPARRGGAPVGPGAPRVKKRALRAVDEARGGTLARAPGPALLAGAAHAR